jgi:transcriptional regulator with XRE-family HTH domain
MPVRTQVLASARVRARTVRGLLGTDIRRARLQAGLRLADIARAIGRSASWISRAERGLVAGIGFDDLVVLGAAVGLKLWTAAYPAERAIHDAPQLGLLRRFRARIGEEWHWSFEVIVPIAHDLRAADAVIQSGTVRIMVEAFTRLADAQAQLRAVHVKARDMGIDRVVIVVAATKSNRRALAEAAGVLAADFPLGTKATLAALTAGRDPGANGLVVI